MDQDYQMFKRENNTLKSELKRFGEITSDKILDLENNINQLGRMKELENDDFTMEKDKL